MELGYPNSGKVESGLATHRVATPVSLQRTPPTHPMLIKRMVKANLHYLLDARITLELSNKDAGGNPPSSGQLHFPLNAGAGATVMERLSFLLEEQR